MMNIALLTAGGTGTRMHQDIPKQFLHVRNKPILIYTMEAFERHPSIDAIIVVGLERWIDIIWAYAKQFNITIFIRLINHILFIIFQIANRNVFAIAFSKRG